MAIDEVIIEDSIRLKKFIVYSQNYYEYSYFVWDHLLI